MILVPPALAAAYLKALNEMGLRDAAIRGNQAFGGPTEAETKQHFASRFGVSASRPTSLFVDPRRLFGAIPLCLRPLFLGGSLRLLDFFCGCGAATLGFLATVAAMREASVAPTLPLNVAIVGADISSTALSIFASLTADCRDEFERRAMEVSLSTIVWDARNVVATRDLVDEFRKSASIDCTVLALIANFSHVSVGRQYDEFRPSLEHIKVAFEERGTVLFIEPGTDDAKDVLSRIADFIRQRLNTNPLESKAEYTWRSPIDGRPFPCRTSALLHPMRRP